MTRTIDDETGGVRVSELSLIDVCIGVIDRELWAYEGMKRKREYCMLIREHRQKLIARRDVLLAKQPAKEVHP